METKNIRWLGHASILVETPNGNIIVDPWKLTNDYKAELVLVTHSHFDHLSVDDIRKVLPKGKSLIAPPDCLDALKEDYSCQAIKPGEEKDLGWVKIRAVKAYNPQKNFHPENNGWVGYIIKTDMQTIYVAGDTDLIPEMKQIRADIALLPVGGTYTMNYLEAASAARLIKPGIAIPIHYGDIVGEENEGEKFAKELSEIKTLILKPELKAKSA
ncbi:MAG: MBL fold metallo-hydrolase [Candidatus Rifleibacteriota bacterium]